MLRFSNEPLMPQASLSDDLAREAWEFAKEIGSVAGAARQMDPPMARNTFAHRVERAMERFNLPHPCGTTVETPFFKSHQPPSKSRTLDELLAHRRDEAARVLEHEHANQITRIELKTPGPVGFLIVGDPHIEDHGTDFILLEKHLTLVRDRQDYIFAGNIGDLQNNWIGRLERLHEKTTVNGEETWKLVEWMMKFIRWTWLRRGNHDLWCGRNDPLNWIVGRQIGDDKAWGGRIGFQHPNGEETRLNAAHDFPGNSLYNPIHALKRELLQGFRDHIIAAGHRHSGADARDTVADLTVCMVRVSGYKVSDNFRQEKGFKVKPLHPSALIISDPDQPDNSPNRVWCAPSVELGIKMLDHMRAEFAAKKAVKVAKRKP
jgi:hypothetical protein